MKKILQISFIHSQYLFLSLLRPSLPKRTNFEKMSHRKICKKICLDLTLKHAGCLKQNKLRLGNIFAIGRGRLTHKKINGTLGLCKKKANFVI